MMGCELNFFLLFFLIFYFCICFRSAVYTVLFELMNEFESNLMVVLFIIFEILLTFIWNAFRRYFYIIIWGKLSFVYLCLSTNIEIDSYHNECRSKNEIILRILLKQVFCKDVNAEVVLAELPFFAVTCTQLLNVIFMDPCQSNIFDYMK